MSRAATGKLLPAASLILLMAAWPAGAMGAWQDVVSNGPSSNRVDIVFLGDGYRSSDIDSGVYSAHVNSMVGHLFSQAQEPFVRYRNFFNVHQVSVISTDAGADVPPLGIYRNTALDASYYWDGVTDRLLYVNENKANTAMNSALAGAPFSAEWKMVTVNDTRYGGGGGGWAVYAGGSSSSTEIALHESGHSFGKLADEYWYSGQTYSGPEPSAVNVTANSNPATVKWSNWIGYVDPLHPSMGPIGVYQGASYSQYGAYRPSSNSKMRTLGQPFDAVSREQLILQIYNYVRPLDGWMTNSTAQVDPGRLWVDVVDPGVIGVTWSVNGQLIASAGGESFYPAKYGLGPGTYQVTADAADTAIGDWVRRSTDKLRQSVSWTLEVTRRPGDGNLDGLVDVADYVLWFNHYGLKGSLAEGDFVGDGVIDVADYTVWFQNYGAGGSRVAGDFMAGLLASAAPVDTTAVPEPLTMTIILAMAVIALPRRRGAW